MTRSQAFKAFLSCFSQEQFPIVFSEDNVSYFSTKNRPLHPDLIRQFIAQGEKDEDDEFTEYIPCVLIADTKDIHAVIYWKGGLLRYDYILCTFNKNGILLHRKVIAGIRSDEEYITRSVATMDEDWIINIVVGQQHIKENYYDPQKSQSMSMELMINGDIVFSLQE